MAENVMKEKEIQKGEEKLGCRRYAAILYKRQTLRREKKKVGGREGCQPKQTPLRTAF
jgi:hypothetical protein